MAYVRGRNGSNALALISATHSATRSTASSTATSDRGSHGGAAGGVGGCLNLINDSVTTSLFGIIPIVMFLFQ